MAVARQERDFDEWDLGRRGSWFYVSHEKKGN
jgi:hypothetical protein